jgi:hypothetical protein
MGLPLGGSERSDQVVEDLVLEVVRGEQALDDRREICRHGGNIGPNRRGLSRLAGGRGAARA